MMPEGVEHTNCIAAIATSVSVTDSMMPEGVEHGVGRKQEDPEDRVTDSMMPEGVEHQTGRLDRKVLHRDRFHDAGRR